MKVATPFIIGFLSGILTGLMIPRENLLKGLISPIGKDRHVDLNEYDSTVQYGFKSLKGKKFSPQKIVLGKIIEENEFFSTRVFYIKTPWGKMSGVINIPVDPSGYPILILLRGYIDREIYYSGMGTKRVGEYFAKNNFITIAPDFLGYAESDKAAENSIEARFQTYTTALSLIASLQNLNQSLDKAADIKARADREKIGIWGHSNGGQIATAILELSGGKYPTVLWAPVSKPFPFSILYFSDQQKDAGKALRKAVAEFEKNHKARDFSPSSYLSWIKAPIQIHQGTEDESVPKTWSDEFVDKLEKLKKEVDYHIYEGADHNLTGNSWSRAVATSLDFFQSNIKAH